MEVEYVVTPKDHIAFNIYHQKCQPWWRRHQACWLACLLVVVLWLAIELWTGAIPDNPAWLIAVHVSALLLCLALVTAQALSSWRSLVAKRVKRWLRRPENRRALGWYSCSIDREGVTNRTEDATTTVMWTGIVRIAQTDDYAFFYYSPTRAFLVPRRPFATDQDFKTFVETARSYRRAARGGSAPDEPHLPKQPGEPDTRITREPAENDFPV
jgi:hypothetical protein